MIANYKLTLMACFVVCSLSNAMEKETDDCKNTDDCNNKKNIVNTIEIFGKKLIKHGVFPLYLFIKDENTTNDPLTSYKLVASSTANSATKKITGSKPKSNIDSRPKQGVGGVQSRINEKLVRLRSLGRKVFVKNGIVDQVAVEQLIRAFDHFFIVDQIMIAQLKDDGALINKKNANLVYSLITEWKEKYLDDLLSDTSEDHKTELEELSKNCYTTLTH